MTRVHLLCVAVHDFHHTRVIGIGILVGRLQTERQQPPEYDPRRKSPVVPLQAGHLELVEKLEVVRLVRVQSSVKAVLLARDQERAVRVGEVKVLGDKARESLAERECRPIRLVPLAVPELDVRSVHPHSDLVQALSGWHGVLPEPHESGVGAEPEDAESQRRNGGRHRRVLWCQRVVWIVVERKSVM